MELDRTPRWVLAVLAYCTAWLAARLVLTYAAPDFVAEQLWFSRYLYWSVIFLSCGLLAARAARERGAERLGWASLSTALLAWWIGDLYFAFELSELEVIPVPSWADAGYLSFYPFAFVGLAALVRSRIRVAGRFLWVDALTAALALAALSAAIVVEAVLGTVGGETLSTITNLAYPLCDLILLGIVVGAVGLRGWRLDRTWALLGAGVVLFWVGDSMWLVQIAEETYSYPSPIDLTWLTTYMILAAAGWQPTRAEAGAGIDVGQGGARLIALPLVFATVGLGVLMVGSLEHFNALAVVFATLALLAVMLRLWLTFRDHAEMLDASRREALTDALTGLGNRRALGHDLDRMLRAAGPDEPLLLVLFDLDGFKHYNDSFGHPAGDALLVRLGQKLADDVAGHGRAYRMGGDEFCALLHPGRADVAPLVRSAARALSEEGEGFAIGCSYGSIQLPDETGSTEEALRLADQRMYAHKQSGRVSASTQTRDVLLRALAERNPELGAHLHDVAELAVVVAGDIGLDEQEIADVRHAAELHDVGKMAIPDSILSKPGPLDAEEWQFMRRHTLIGERIIAAAPALRRVAELVRASHERHDGDGYPDGLAGEDIPLGARIIAVCDAFDAMTTDRPYRAGMPIPDALAELSRCAGTQFDPAVVRSFTRALTARPLLRAAA